MKRIITLLTVIGLILAVAPARADIPHVMNFQGKAIDKTTDKPLDTVIDAKTYDLTFRIYNTVTEGTPLWTETHSNVQITNGIFQVLLGSVTPLDLPFDEEYWISVEIIKNGVSDGEMTPRTPLASVGYAYKAKSLVDGSVVRFYKKGFEVEYVDFNSIKVSPGVMDVAGKMFTTTTYSNNLQLEYATPPANQDWVNGSKTPNSFAYVYAYNNNGAISFKFSDEAPDLSDHLGNTEQKPLLYQRYPDTTEGVYYRYIGTITIDSGGAIGAIKSIGKGEANSIFSTFGSDGTDGDITVSSNTNFSTLTGSTDNYYLKANNFTLNSGQILTVDTGWAYIGVKGTCTIHGSINADGQGEPGGLPLNNYPGGAGRRADGIGDISGGTARPGLSFTAATDMPLTDDIIGSLQHPVDFCISGAGGGGGFAGGSLYGGAGGGAGSYGGQGGAGRWPKAAVATPANKIKILTGGSTGNILSIVKYRGAGGGSGSGGTFGGGSGGGVIYIECNELVFDGTLTADGANGSSPPTGNDTAAGGGGGGGIILIRAKTLTTNTGSLTVTGGSGGTTSYVDKQGAAGAAGFKDIILVN